MAPPVENAAERLRLGIEPVDQRLALLQLRPRRIHRRLRLTRRFFGRHGGRFRLPAAACAASSAPRCAVTPSSASSCCAHRLGVARPRRRSAASGARCASAASSAPRTACARVPAPALRDRRQSAPRLPLRAVTSSLSVSASALAAANASALARRFRFEPLRAFSAASASASSLSVSSARSRVRHRHSVCSMRCVPVRRVRCLGPPRFLGQLLGEDRRAAAAPRLPRLPCRAAAARPARP